MRKNHCRNILTSPPWREYAALGLKRWGTRDNAMQNMLFIFELFDNRKSHEYTTSFSRLATKTQLTLY